MGQMQGLHNEISQIGSASPMDAHGPQNHQATAMQQQ